MDTYKQICTKLVEAWDDTADGEYEDFGRAASYLVDWTRDALAEPEPEKPTDEELLCIAAKSIEPYDQILPGEYEPESNSAVEVYGSELIIYARAVLARWGK